MNIARSEKIKDSEGKPEYQRCKDAKEYEKTNDKGFLKHVEKEFYFW